MRFQDIILCDSKAIISQGRKENINLVRGETVKAKNRESIKASLADLLSMRMHLLFFLYRI